MIRNFLRKIKQKVIYYYRKVFPPGYWAERKNMAYYNEVLRVAKEYAGEAETVIDVGPRDTPFIKQFKWISDKTALDLEFMPTIRGATNLQGDFMTYEFPQKFDLVLCLQVLEHLEAPEAFARKLLDTGCIVIISVPYMWPEGECEYHCQDPVDEDKVVSWTGKTYLKKVIVEDLGVKRLITVFDGN